MILGLSSHNYHLLNALGVASALSSDLLTLSTIPANSSAGAVELYAQQCRLRIQNPVVPSRQRFQGKIVGSKCLAYQALRSITMNSLSYRLL